MIYAIDFGTTNSLLAAAEKDQVFGPIPLDPDAEDPTILRSILYFPTMKECFYGARAIREFGTRDTQGRLLRSVKRFLPMRSFIGTFVEDRPINLEDIIGIFLGEMRRRANAHFGKDVDSALFGRPARFSADPADDSFAQYRLERAARNAGFKHVEFCPEPLAASFAFRRTMTEPKVVLVADFGGGTSDYTVIRLARDEAFKDSDVLSIGGVPLAGDAMDSALMRFRVSKHFGAEVQYKVPFGSNVLTMPTSLMERICQPADIALLRKRDTMEFFRNVRQWSLGDEDREKMDQLFTLIEDQLGFPVFEEIERAKRALSASERTELRYEYPGVSISEKISRKAFEEMAQERVRQILDSLDETVKAAGLKFGEIDLVCCTGGTAKLPILHRELVRRFGEAKIREQDAFHSVVQGLGERARMLA